MLTMSSQLRLQMKSSYTILSLVFLFSFVDHKTFAGQVYFSRGGVTTQFYIPEFKNGNLHAAFEKASGLVVPGFMFDNLKSLTEAGTFSSRHEALAGSILQPQFQKLLKPEFQPEYDVEEEYGDSVSSSSSLESIETDKWIPATKKLDEKFASKLKMSAKCNAFTVNPEKTCFSNRIRKAQPEFNNRLLPRPLSPIRPIGQPSRFTFKIQNSEEQVPIDKFKTSGNTDTRIIFAQNPSQNNFGSNQQTINGGPNPQVINIGPPNPQIINRGQPNQQITNVGPPNQNFQPQNIQDTPTFNCQQSTGSPPTYNCDYTTRSPTNNNYLEPTRSPPIYNYETTTRAPPILNYERPTSSPTRPGYNYLALKTATEPNYLYGQQELSTPSQNNKLAPVFNYDQLTNSNPSNNYGQPLPSPAAQVSNTYPPQFLNRQGPVSYDQPRKSPPNFGQTQPPQSIPSYTYKLLNNKFPPVFSYEPRGPLPQGFPNSPPIPPQQSPQSINNYQALNNNIPPQQLSQSGIYRPLNNNIPPQQLSQSGIYRPLNNNIPQQQLSQSGINRPLNNNIPPQQLSQSGIYRPLNNNIPSVFGNARSRGPPIGYPQQSPQNGNLNPLNGNIRAIFANAQIQNSPQGYPNHPYSQPQQSPQRDNSRPLNNKFPPVFGLEQRDKSPQGYPNYPYVQPQQASPQRINFRPVNNGNQVILNSQQTLLPQTPGSNFNILAPISQPIEISGRYGEPSQLPLGYHGHVQPLTQLLPATAPSYIYNQALHALPSYRYGEPIQSSLPPGNTRTYSYGYQDTALPTNLLPYGSPNFIPYYNLLLYKNPVVIQPQPAVVPDPNYAPIQ